MFIYVYIYIGFLSSQVHPLTYLKAQKFSHKIWYFTDFSSIPARVRKTHAQIYPAYLKGKHIEMNEYFCDSDIFVNFVLI